jgi:hypothetical protein
VRFNGRVYERLHALLDHRRPLDLYHSALVVTVPEGRFVIENSWPIPKASGVTRGVTVEGPVGSRHLRRFRALRYEVRVWGEGTIADVDEAVASPQLLSNDEAQARRVLEMAARVPACVWGRDQLGTGEMWNSNSVISWVLARGGLPAAEIQPLTSDTGDPPCPSGECEVDLESIASHEFGHATGRVRGGDGDLGHFTQANNGAICNSNADEHHTMCRSGVAGTTYDRTLNTHDKDTFESAY